MLNRRQFLSTLIASTTAASLSPLLSGQERDQHILYQHVTLKTGNQDLLATLTSDDQVFGPHQVDVILNH